LYTHGIYALTSSAMALIQGLTSTGVYAYNKVEVALQPPVVLKV